MRAFLSLGLAVAITVGLNLHGRVLNEPTSPKVTCVVPSAGASCATTDMAPGLTAAMSDEHATLAISDLRAASGDVDHVLCATAESTCEEPEVPRLLEPIARSAMGWGSASAALQVTSYLTRGVTRWPAGAVRNC